MGLLNSVDLANVTQNGQFHDAFMTPAGYHGSTFRPGPRRVAGFGWGVDAASAFRNDPVTAA